MNLLSEIVPRLNVLKDDDFAVVDDLFTIKEYSAGDVILKSGQICRKLYLFKRAWCMPLQMTNPKEFCGTSLKAILLQTL